MPDDEMRGFRHMHGEVAMASRQKVDLQINPLKEQWPNIRFMGLGAWWAWIWLCYGSLVVMSTFDLGVRPERVFQMYAISTPAIACCMLIAGCFSMRIEAIMDTYDKPLCLGFGFFAALSTLLLELSGMVNVAPLFYVSAALTGIGTSYLCLRTGKLYGSVGLGESLTGGTISLIFAGLLYFMGIALPSTMAALYTCAMPVLAAIMLSIEDDDSFTVINTPENLSEHERKATSSSLRRVALAGGIIALTAGLGKGIASMQAAGEAFAEQNVLVTFSVVIIGLLILLLINFKGAVFAITNAYTALILLGIAVMIGLCIGVPSAYLNVGKEVLWLILSVLLAYLAFRYSLSPIRVFGFGQMVYFFMSTAGWIAGYFLSPYYGDFSVAVGTSLAMVFAVVLVVLYILPTTQVSKIVRSGATVTYASQEDSSLDEPAAFSPSQAAVAQAWSDARAEVNAGSAYAGKYAGGYAGGFAAPVAAAFGVSLDDSAGDEAAFGEQAASDGSFDYGRAADPLYGLSKRELEIMALFAQGRSANWIAESECVSKNTVRTHLRNVYAKLDVHTRQELLDFIAGK